MCWDLCVCDSCRFALNYPAIPTTCCRWRVRVAGRWSRCPESLKINGMASPWSTYIFLCKSHSILPQFLWPQAFLQLLNINSGTLDNNFCPNLNRFSTDTNETYIIMTFKWFPLICQLVTISLEIWMQINGTFYWYLLWHWCWQFGL